MMIKLKNIAQYLNAEIVGNGHLEIKGILRNPEFKENYITVVNQEEVKMQNSLNEDRRRIALLTIKVQKEFNCLIAQKKDMELPQKNGHIVKIKQPFSWP
ncbi:hypothetical protein J7K93_01350 [bacterium]|nr:hypothetical protein [bacterium]